MRKLTSDDLANVTGTTVQGYVIESARIKRGPFSDSDHYGIVLGRNQMDNYVTWQFHLDEREEPSFYWGHYFGAESRTGALRDYESRDLGVKPFKVTVTETLKLTVDVEAEDQTEAEQIASDNWKTGEYVLGADNFVDVEFEAVGRQD
ncbi:hypothetical protein FACS1894219_08250 [Clostridia bacterium]|nr:hypothetical protein FACS1894219_08250 [Clostridia bacterium]